MRVTSRWLENKDACGEARDWLCKKELKGKGGLTIAKELWKRRKAKDGNDYIGWLWWGIVNCDDMKLIRKCIELFDIEAKDIGGRTALMYAVFHLRMDIIKLLIKHGANIKAKSDSGWTALRCANWSGRTDIIKLLKGES